MFARHLRRIGGLVAAAACSAVAIAGIHAAPPAEAETSPDPGHLEFLFEQDGEWYTVGVYMLFGAGATDAEVAAAREAIISRFPGAILPGDDGVSAQFTLTGPVWEGASTTWTYNATGKPTNLTGDFEALATVANTWNTAGSPFRFVGNGPTTTTTDACGTQRDGQNVVGWAPQSGPTLGVTCVWSKLVDGRKVFVEFDMEFDPDWNWTTSTDSARTDFHSVALHEFGHALGIDHTQAANCPGPVMCSSYGDGKLVRTLASDDLQALFALYGQSAIPTQAPAATQPPAPTATAPIGQRGPFRIVAPGAARE